MTSRSKEHERKHRTEGILSYVLGDEDYLASRL